jgi:peptidoglycan/LPS O-acetylase OafA/YrhL
MFDPSRIRKAFSLRANAASLWDRTGERYASIDGLRALSMLWVVLTHECLGVTHFVAYDAYVRMLDASPWFFRPVLHGEKALDSFFVISGFLIGLMLLTEYERKGRIQLRRFYARRYLRLMPAYAVALAVLLAAGSEGPEKARYVWANILYVNNFLPQRHMFMDPSWSLAVEEQFYLCLPLFLLGVFLRVRRPFVSLAALLGLSLVIDALVLALHPGVTRVPYSTHFIACAPGHTSEYFDALYVNLHTRFAPFVLGLGLAWAIVHHQARLKEILGGHPQLPDAVLAIGLLLLAVVVAVPAFDPHVTIPERWLWAYVLVQRHVWSLGVLLVMIAVLFPGGPLSQRMSRVLAARIWFPIAQLSYCSYLFHLGCVLVGLYLTMALVHPGVPFENALALMRLPELLVSYVIGLFITFLLGAVLYLSVERPFLNLRPR